MKKLRNWKYQEKIYPFKNKKKFIKNINSYIDIVKSILIGSVILDLYMEQNNKSIRMFPSLNYYYYKLKPTTPKN